MKPVIAAAYVVSTAIKPVTVKWKGYFFETAYDDVYANLSLSFLYLPF